MKKSIITTSWDDGHPLDFKIYDLLLQNNLKGTFYVPIFNKENPVITKNEIQKISQHFEIGGHTLNHTVLTSISLDDAKREIVQGKEQLESICGKIISFAYPRGQYNQEIKKIVKDAGFEGGRTAEMLHTKIADKFEYHPTIHATDRVIGSRAKQVMISDTKLLSARLFTSGKIFKTWDNMAKQALDFVLEHGGIWHIWGHSWEIEQNNDWDRLADVLEYAKLQGEQKDAEFLTNGQIFEKDLF